MDLEQLRRIRDLLDDITNLPHAEKLAQLEAICNGDSALFNEAVSLLEKDEKPTHHMRDLFAKVETAVDLTGIRVGAWRLIQQLGRGGMAEVWLAERDDGVFRMKSALKLVHRHLCTRDLIKRFERERQILADLRHPHIACLLDGGDADGRPYMVLEYVDGKRIDDYCAAHDPPFFERLRMIQKIASATAYAHGMRVIHRDIKPSNIMVSAAGEPKLLDFGIAFLNSDDTALTGTGMSPMTPEYAAPEQFHGGEVCEQTDIYALGLVLLQLVTGRRPRELGGAPLDLLRDGAFPNLSEAMCAFLRRALAAEPNKRHSSILVFAAELGRLISAESNPDDHSAPVLQRLHHGSDSVVKTLLVSHLTNRSHLLKALGDQRAANLFDQHHGVIRQLLQTHHGRGIHQSDGLLAVFERPIHAVTFALTYHQTLATLIQEEALKPHARIGIHLGEVVLRLHHDDETMTGFSGLDVEGLDKLITTRLAALAGADQTLLSWSAYQMAGRAAVDHAQLNNARWLEHGDYRFEGLDHPLTVFEVGLPEQAPLSAPPNTAAAVREKDPTRLQGGSHFDAANPVGGQIGPYLIIKAMKHSGKDAAFLAVRKDDELETRVVIKTLPRTLTEAEVQRFRHNRQLLADLKHPHIAMVLDGGATREGVLYFIREHVAGQSTLHWIAAKNPSLIHLIKFFHQAAATIHFAHQNGILHGNIKPHNLWMTTAAELKLLDFNLSGSNAEDLDKADTAFGEYASPEQKQSQPIQETVDVYALGLVFLQVLIGGRPNAWDQPPIHMVGRLMAEGRNLFPLPVTPPDTCVSNPAAEDTQPMWAPEPLGDILRNALAVDPQKRYPDMMSFTTDLERLYAGLVLAADSHPTPRAPTHDLLLWSHLDDRDDVRVLAEFLSQREGLTVWFEAWHTPLGASLEEALAPVLDSIPTLLVCLGPGQRTPWRQSAKLTEAFSLRAVNHAVRVLPLLLPGAHYPTKQSDLPAFLRHRTWITFPHGLEPAGMQLLARSAHGDTTHPDQQSLITECPFRGLEAFRERDQHLFFGREATMQRLEEYLLEHPFAAVLGASGSGKSSVVQAGLIPRMRKHNHAVILFQPGSQPLEELAFALSSTLRQAGDADQPILPPEQLLERLRHTPESLHFIGREAAEVLGKDRILLVVNQFEEVFTQTNDSHARDTFIRTLCHAADQAGGRIAVVVVMRSDFIGHCAPWPDLNTFISDHFIQVGPMTRDQLKTAVEEPARLAHLQLERGLTDRILDDVLDAVGGLPLMQHALLELYELRRGTLLTLASYQHIDGIQGALVRRAESEYEVLDLAQRKTLRQMFVLCLVHPGEGAAATRRRATLSELVNVAAKPETAVALVRRWIQARLFTGGHDPVSGQDVVDVAHEALIRQWPRIDVWMQEGRARAKQMHRLRQDARAWEESNRHADNLLRGVPLQQAEALAAGEDVHFGALEQAFLKAGASARDRAEAEREARRRAELAAAKKRVRQTVLVAGAFVLVVGLGAAFSLKARNQAELRRGQADDLIGFMLGDLRTKLKSVDRLDVLDGVGAKVRDYLGTLPEDEMEGEVLAKQIAMLHLIGEVEAAQNNRDQARQSFQQALTKSMALARRNPNHSDRQMLLLVSHYWIATLAYQDQQLDLAEVHHRATLDIADHMTQVLPKDDSWSKERSYALNNLGAVYRNKGQWDQALTYFERSIAEKEAILKRNPDDHGLRLDLAESLAWLATLLREQAYFARAKVCITRTVALQRELTAADPNRRRYKQRLQSALFTLTDISACLGEREDILPNLYHALEINRELTAYDPENDDWKRLLTLNYIVLGERHAERDQWTEAQQFATLAEALCAAVPEDRQSTNWKTYAARTRQLEAWLGYEAHDLPRALVRSREAMALWESLLSRTNPYFVMQGLNRQGLIYSGMGEPALAKQSWERSLRLFQPEHERDVHVIGEQALALLYLGRGGEASNALKTLRELAFRDEYYWETVKPWLER